MNTLRIVLGLAFLFTLPQAQAGLYRREAVPMADQGPRSDAQVYLPKNFSRDRRWPLVVLLHGFTSTATLQELYMMLGNHVSKKGFVLLVPEGTANSKGEHFWNATEQCCDGERSGVDDSGYLQRLITKVEARYAIDSHRISLYGHSNGSFMAHRLACDAGGRFSGIASLAGSTFADPTFCEDRQPVSILHAHGTGDATIPYAGAPNIPGAIALMEHWSRRDGCTGTDVRNGALDLSPLVPGADTDVLSWTGCRDSTEVVHWRINGVGHIPFLWPRATSLALDFLLAHRRQ